MKILIAPNSMKGSLSAFDFAAIVEKAFLSVSEEFEVHKIPVADGGDLSGEVLARSMNAEKIDVEVTGPLGKKVKSFYSKSGNAAIIEMADASGMKLLKAEELNPMEASSFGTGELIKHAVENGCSDIYLAIGGSATVDGGLGMLRALGYQLLDDQEKEVEGQGKDLIQLKKIIPSTILNKVKIRIICDVDNPLLGEKGAARIFGPQKGADQTMVEELEAGLKNLSDVLFQQTGLDLNLTQGAGAAGGLSVPLLAFSNAEIVPGADFICDKLELEKWILWSDLVITGEGKIDHQTLNNKAPYAVAKRARKHQKTVIAIGGKVEAEASLEFDGCFSLVNGPVTLEDAMNHAGEYLYQTARELATLIYSLNKKGEIIK